MSVSVLDNLFILESQSLFSFIFGLYGISFCEHYIQTLDITILSDRPPFELF